MLCYYRFLSDLMREKLEKWRRMKGRSSVCGAMTVYNRSGPAVSSDINKNANCLQKRFFLLLSWNLITFTSYGNLGPVAVCINHCRSRVSMNQF